MTPKMSHERRSEGLATFSGAKMAGLVYAQKRVASEKGDRALELRQQGLGRAIIAERLGVKPRKIDGMI